MIAVTAKATTTEDNIGIKSNIPIILTKHSELSTITVYLLHFEANGFSITTMNRIIQATTKLIKYTDANTEDFNDPKRMFQTFTERPYRRTISEDGVTPSSLYLIPTSTSERPQ
jgi:hypothetical protein